MGKALPTGSTAAKGKMGKFQPTRYNQSALPSMEDFSDLEEEELEKADITQAQVASMISLTLDKQNCNASGKRPTGRSWYCPHPQK